MVEKAKIRVLEGPDKGDIDFPAQTMYNPVDYNVKKEIQKTGKGGKIQFNSVDIPEYSIKLFFDTYEKKTDVREYTEKIVSLLKPTVKGKHTKRPPICLYVWGSFSYRGIVSRVNQKFLLFIESGVPVRAELDVTFSSVLIKEEEAELSSRSESRKLWPVKTGDRLDLIAYSTLKDPAQWRKIAEANEIDNPLSFPDSDDIGRILIIPE
jgi:nucleoid-associated protein YgaU